MKKVDTGSNIELMVFDSRQEMGRRAGADAEAKMVELLGKQDIVRVIFAAAPSQNEVLDYLGNSSRIDWSRVEAFHMDEYRGLSSEAPQAFSMFLRCRLFDKINAKGINLIAGNNNSEDECKRYSTLLNEAPIDVVCMGIGENGHIAFNDPPVADFEDPVLMKQVELDDMCRQQQVNDGCFAMLDDVPTHALTLTIPMLMSGKYLFCTVPGETKKDAVYNTITGKVSSECPATILQKHENCRMYVDADSSSRLEK